MNSILFAFATFQGWTLAKWVQGEGVYIHTLKEKFALHGSDKRKYKISGLSREFQSIVLDLMFAVSNVNDVFDDFVHNFENRDVEFIVRHGFFDWGLNGASRFVDYQRLIKVGF